MSDAAARAADDAPLNDWLTIAPRQFWPIFPQYKIMQHGGPVVHGTLENELDRGV